MRLATVLRAIIEDSLSFLGIKSLEDAALGGKVSHPLSFNDFFPLEIVLPKPTLVVVASYLLELLCDFFIFSSTFSLS